MRKPKNVIVLLRHGQYLKEPQEKLTKLGIKQAKLAGKRLREFSFDDIYASTMPRAEETAHLVVEQFEKKQKIYSDKTLCECVPGFPEKLKKKFKVKKETLTKDKAQADKAFNKFFKKKDEEKTTLLVCHGNIIRYFVCRALGVEANTWTKMDIHQCGFSILEYSSDTKSFELITHNEVGHIKLKERTFI